MSEKSKDLVPIDQFTEQFRSIIESVGKALATEKDEQLSQLRLENGSLRREVEQLQAVSEDRFASMAQDIRGTQDASARRLMNSDRYYVRTVLGNNFSPEISGKRMTKLM